MLSMYEFNLNKFGVLLIKFVVKFVFKNVLLDKMFIRNGMFVFML